MSSAKQRETQLPSSLVWSHATNSLSALQAVLDPASKVNFVEADVVQPPDDDAAEPIMAHPPATSSDLTFRHFVDKVIEHNRAKHASFEGDAEKSPTPAIGLKLDFKSPAAVERCISHLLSHKNALSEARVPLWLNADLWKGPGGADSPFSAAAFASQCTRMLREYEATSLSLGWTTGGDDEPYTECHVEEALESLRKLGLLRIAVNESTTDVSSPLPGASNAANTQPGPNCQLNDFVECLHRGQWVAGRVCCINNTRDPPQEWADDNTVNVLLANGQNNYAIGLGPHEVRVLRPLQVGDRVRAVQGGALWGKTDFVPGRVINVRSNGKYDVAFDDTTMGDVEEHMDRIFIRLENSVQEQGALSASDEAPALPNAGGIVGKDGGDRDDATDADHVPLPNCVDECALCHVTFPVKATLAAASNESLWRRLLTHCTDFSLTVWGRAGEKELAWIESIVQEFPRRIYVDVQRA